MSENFLHGVEVLEEDDGLRPIPSVRSGIIGIVGTAPNSAPERKATRTSGSVSANNGLTWTSKRYGANGNDYSVHLVNPRASSQALTVSLSSKTIVVSLATDATGALTSTAAQVLAAVQAEPAADALVTVAATGASTGAGIVTADYRAVVLSGGVNEPFPLNTPVLIAGNQREAAALGNTGTLPWAMDGIFKQTGAVVIVVRVAEGVDDAQTMDNVVGGVSTSTGQYTGCWAFMGAESGVGYCPKILIAPGFTHRTENSTSSVAVELAAIAHRLRAVVIKDGPNTTDADAIDDRRNFGSKRVFIVDPFVTVVRDGVKTNLPASPYVAGLIARIDNDKGFWHSPSNQEIFGIVGVARPVDFKLGDTTSRANLLNERDVATIIRHDGWRLWGNRTTSSDPKWAFLSVVRTADTINESLLQAHMWAVDRNITRTYFDDVVAGVNAYLARLKTQGAIIGGNCWADKNFNTPAEIQNGHATFSFDFTAPYPAERVTFRSAMVNNYLEEIL